MNSQQELLNAINAINEKSDKSYDTPATVLRVEGDTVWVHIDGGADETPVQRTINCEQGETVQVRISNGSAFLVGNASAPPTDDKTANVAHFVAVEADAKATQAIETANAIVQTVSEKVAIGDSNIADLSSTMYQDAYGVNIFNDTLAVGDSYAHIDGDSFDIKEATTAGTIDNVNDKTVATFGQESVLYQTVYNPEESEDYGSIFTFNPVELKIEQYNNETLSSGEAEINTAGFTLLDGSTQYETIFGVDKIFNGANYDFSQWPRNTANIDYEYGKLYIRNEIRTGGKITDANGNKIAPTILTSTTISAATTSYTFTDAAITTDSVIDIYDDIFGFSPTGITVTTGSATITFSAQASTHTIKLFVY